MFGCDSMVPFGLVVSSPPKMLGWDEEWEPSENVVSWPPKMLGCEDVCASGVVQSWPPKKFGRHDTCASPRSGNTSSQVTNAMTAPMRHWDAGGADVNSPT